MSRLTARTHLRTTATFTAAAAAVVMTLTGCSTVNRIGSFLGIGGSDDQPEPKPIKTQFADTGANSTTGGADPFDPFGPIEGEPLDRSGLVRNAGTFTPWSSTPGAGVYGEIKDSLMGPTSFGLQQTGADNLDQISFAHDGADFDPSIAPTGDFLVYASTQHSPTADIYRKGVSGHTITQLTNDPANDVMPVVSPDGLRIAFASDRSGGWNIYVMNVTGGQAVQITNDPAPQLHPTWSPDGRYLAYCRLGETSGRWELWVTEVQNPAVRHFIGFGLLPEWSPVGNKIVFQRSRDRGDRFFSIWTIDFINGEGVNPTEIVSSPVAACVNPAFSPDGKRIAFAVIPNPDSQSGPTPEIADLWITNIDGTGRSNLTGGLFTNLMPTWGHDQRIYFISNRSGSDNIWALRPERAILAATGPTTNNTSGVAEAKPNAAADFSAIATVPESDQ